MHKGNNVIPRYVGTPFHGLVENFSLTLPDSSTMPVYVGSAHPDGPSYVLQNPVLPTFTQTPEQIADDTANGREWRTYALRTGSYVNGVICTSDQAIVYIDPAGTPWNLQIVPTYPVDNSIMHIEVQNRGRMGFMSHNVRTVNTPVLHAQDFSLIRPPFADPEPLYYQWYPATSVLTSFQRLTQNRNGSTAMFNVTVGNLAEQQLNQVVTVTVSGIGDLASATYGDGISVSFSVETLPHTGVARNVVKGGTGGGLEQTDSGGIITATPSGQTSTALTTYWQDRVFYKYIDTDETIKKVSVRINTEIFRKEEYGGDASHDCNVGEALSRNGSFTFHQRTQIDNIYDVGGVTFSVVQVLEDPENTFSGDDITYGVECSPVFGGPYINYVASSGLVEAYYEIHGTASITYTANVVAIEPYTGAVLLRKDSDPDLYVWYKGREVNIGVPPGVKYYIAYNPITDSFASSLTGPLIYI